MIQVKQYTGNLEDLLNWELDLEFWQESQEIIKEALPYPDELATIKVYFAYAGNQIVGYIIGGDDLQPNECWRIAVDLFYRGQGIGTQLVDVSGLCNPRQVEASTEARGFWASTGYRVPTQKVLVTV